MTTTLDQTLGRDIAAALTIIADELVALGPSRTAADEHAAFANGIAAILTELRKAGHEPPAFMRSALNRMIQSAPGIPHRHTDKMFTVQSDQPAERDQAGYVERMKKALKIELVSALAAGPGATPTTAARRVASALTEAAIPTTAKQLLAWRKEASRRNKKSDWEDQLIHAHRLINDQPLLPADLLDRTVGVIRDL